MSQAYKNLKFLREKFKLTQESFSKKIGIKRSLLGAYEENRAEPNLELIKNICQKFDLSFEEFLFKDLSEIKKSRVAKRSKKNNPLSYREKRHSDKLIRPKNSILLVPIKAAAGYLQGYSDENFLNELNSFTLPMISNGNFRAFEIKGDSMLPTPSGSIVIGQKLKNITDIKSSNTYVIITNDQGIVFKRIIKKDNNKLTLVSDNKIFKPFSINPEDILEIWKAQYVIQKSSLDLN